LKRLALLWLACAAIGFAVAASTAVVIAIACDHGPNWRDAMVAVPAQSAPRNVAEPPRAIDTGRRLLGE
jgi:hypothetical protein